MNAFRDNPYEPPIEATLASSRPAHVARPFPLLAMLWFALGPPITFWSLRFILRSIHEADWGFAAVMFLIPTATAWIYSILILLVWGIRRLVS